MALACDCDMCAGFTYHVLYDLPTLHATKKEEKGSKKPSILSFWHKYCNRYLHLEQ